MATSQKFGGNWTEEKLNIFTSYLDAYLIALQNQKFKKVYIDAFAGTVEIETSDGDRNSPMFLFCFAISNESEAAQKLALRIANHILKNK